MSSSSEDAEDGGKAGGRRQADDESTCRATPINNDSYRWPDRKCQKRKRSTLGEGKDRKSTEGKGMELETTSTAKERKNDRTLSLCVCKYNTGGTKISTHLDCKCLEMQKELKGCGEK